MSFIEGGPVLIANSDCRKLVFSKILYFGLLIYSLIFYYITIPDPKCLNFFYLNSFMKVIIFFQDGADALTSLKAMEEKMIKFRTLSEQLRIFVSYGKSFKNAASDGKLTRKEAIEVEKVYSKHLSRLVPDSEYFQDPRVFGKPLEAMVKTHELLEVVGAIRKKAFLIETCYANNSCSSYQCSMTNAIRLAENARNVYLSIIPHVKFFKDVDDLLSAAYHSSCPVCIGDELKASDKFIFLFKCKHVFCERCFIQWNYVRRNQL